MFNYYIKTLYRNERGIWKLRQWILRGTCECFLIICIYECNIWMVFFYNLFIWIESMDGFFFIICWYEWNMSMLSVLFACMNGISECFLYWFYMNGIYGCFFHNMCIWMEHVNIICIVCLYEWHQWMFSLLFLYEWNLYMFALSFVYINGIFGCFLRQWFR
jgi:hypothetical protein